MLIVQVRSLYYCYYYDKQLIYRVINIINFKIVQLVNGIIKSTFLTNDILFNVVIAASD